MSTTKHPASVMMVGVVAWNGEKMPPVWFSRGYRLTAAAYKDALVTKILSWMRNITNNANYLFQQDGAPAHTAKIVQEWLGSDMNFWPPQSPDLSPSTTASGRILRARPVKFATAVSVEELKSSVNRFWASMRKDFIRKVCNGFRPRLCRVIAAEGGHIE